jgi:uncharacterized protein
MMKANGWNLGVGLGFRRPLMGQIFLQQPRIDFLEIIADHYLGGAPERDEELALLAAHFPLVPHGIGLSLGSAEGVDRDYLRMLAALVRLLDPPWWSEHLSFTRAGGVDIGHLAPMPFTWEAVEVVCRNVQIVQAAVEAPLILENVTYMVALPGAEMTEAQFIAEVSERCDCGLLLDVTNLYTNAANHGYDARGFLDELPLERVVQLHFAGGVWEGGVLVDSHSEATHAEAWELMDAVLTRVPVPGAVLERDEKLPPLSELLGELDHAREIGRRYGRWD